MKIYVEKIDNGQGYINYYQPTTTQQFKKYIKNRGILKAIVKFENSNEYEELSINEIMKRL